MTHDSNISLESNISFSDFWTHAVLESSMDGDSYELGDTQIREDGIECTDLYFRGVDQAKIACLLVRPYPYRIRTPGVCFFHGYRRTQHNMHARDAFENLLPTVLSYANEGFAVLFMYTRGQCLESKYPNSNSTYKHVHMYLHGLLDSVPNNAYCRAIYTDAAKCARILMQLDCIDPQNISAVGFSQGGDLAIACAALVPRVAKVVCGGITMTNCCEMLYRTANLGKGWSLAPAIVHYYMNHDPEQLTLGCLARNISYFDECFLAPRIRAKVLQIVGRQDSICPPEGQIVLHKCISSVKQLFLWDGGHVPHPCFFGELPKLLQDPNFPFVALE